MGPTLFEAIKPKANIKYGGIIAFSSDS